MTHFVLSTIAMTLYNYLQLAGDRTAMEIVNLDSVQDQHPGVDVGVATAALNELVDAGKLTLVDGKYVSRDPRRRLVTVRDRSDAETHPDGSVTGGWNGWQVQNGTSRIPIEEAIR